MKIQDYEVIDNLHQVISDVSRNEGIDRAQVLRVLKERLMYQQRRIDAFIDVGWINNEVASESKK